MKIDFTIHNQHLTIHIDQILHLRVACDNVCSIHSYKLSEQRWVIELGLKEGQNIELSYVSRKMWSQVLRKLEVLNLC